MLQSLDWLVEVVSIQTIGDSELCSFAIIGSLTEKLSDMFGLETFDLNKRSLEPFYVSSAQKELKKLLSILKLFSRVNERNNLAPISHFMVTRSPH